MSRAVPLWLSGLFLGACAASHPTAAAPSTPPKAPAALAEEAIPAMQLPRDVRPTRYRLELDIDPDQPRFTGQAEIDVSLDAPRQVLWLHGLDLEVRTAEVVVGGAAVPARYEQVNDDGVVKVSLARPVGPGPATLRLAWSAAFDPRVVGLYLAKEAGISYAYTQFEDIFARRAFPGFDEPGFKTPFEVSLVVPAADVAVANTGVLSEEPAGPGKKRLRFAPTRPLPTYLLAWAVGPFEVVEAAPLPPTPLRSWAVPVRGVAPKGRGGELGFALQASRELLLLEEQYFGLAYPYPKLDAIAVPDYAYGAMENAGAIHYREDLLLVKDGVTSERRKAVVADVIAHEQAHQWFGDLVTMPWWDEAWLNESFATWLGTRMTQTWRPEYHAALDLQKEVDYAMGNDALVTARAIRQPLKRVKDIRDQFDGLTYQKGAAVLGMFERSMGAEAFRQGVSAYVAAHADGSGSTEELLASFSRAAGRDVGPAFRTFLDQAGVPLVQATVSCTPTPALTLKQSRFFPLGSSGVQDRRWQVPVCARYSVGGKVSETCTVLEAAEATVALPGCPAWLVPNADAAGYYRWSMAGEDLRKLVGPGYAQLSVTERVALAATLRAAVEAGTLPIADALEALAAIARDPEGEVATEALPLLEFTRERVLRPEQQALVDAYSVKLFGPVMARLGYAARPGDTTSSRRLRGQLMALLAQAGHPETVREASRLGRAYAGLADGRFHPEAVEPELAGVALGVAVQHGDRALFDALKARLDGTDDGMLRGRILSALGQARDPERARAALELSLDPTLRKQEGLTALFNLAQDQRTREAAWRFLQEHFDAVVAKVPPTHAASIPYLAASFCDTAHADQARAFFQPRAEPLPGMPKVVREVDESIRLCAAQAAAQRGSAERFFGSKAGASPVKAPAGR